MKIYYRILIILLIILCLLLVYDVTFRRFKTPQSKMTFEKFIKEYSNDTRVFRKPTGTNYKGKPIVLYGCSFTYGEKLKEEDTFSYQLAEYIKRPVYNYGILGHCLQHALFLMRKDDHYKNFPEPEYIIYTFIPAHITRINNTNFFGHTAYLQYKVKNNHLVQTNSIFRFFHPTYRYNCIKEYDYNKYFDKDKTKRLNFIKLHFLEAKEAFQTKYPNSKFVILLYDYEYLDFNTIWKDLEKEGFIIYKVSELADINPGDQEYKIPIEIDRWQHPNRKVWEIVVPKLSKALNLK